MRWKLAGERSRSSCAEWSGAPSSWQLRFLGLGMNVRGRVTASAAGVLLAAGLLGVLTVGSVALPQPTVRVTLAESQLVAGPPVVLPWASRGQGALIASGVGTVSATGGSVPVPIASVAKVMTALVVLADHPLAAGAPGPSLLLTAQDAADYQQRLPTGQSLLAVSAGERLSERQALEGLLLPSADNIADVLARWDGPPATFLAKMNALAHAAGATQTHYTDPSGLDPATVSTAADQVQVARVALRSPVLMEIVGERAAVLPVAGVVRNYNSLLGGSTGVFGLKTGSTRAAGGCLVFAARTLVAGRQVVFIGALLGHDVGQPPLTALRSALLVVQAALAQAETQVVRAPVLPPGLPVASISTAWGARTTVRLHDPPGALVLPGTRSLVTIQVRCPRPPVSAGASCGLVTVVVGDALSATSTYRIRPTTSEGLSTPKWGWRLRHAVGLE